MPWEENVNQLENDWLHGSKSTVYDLSKSIKRNGRATASKTNQTINLKYLETGVFLLH